MAKNQALERYKQIPYPLANREMIMTGPKDSSLAMNMWSSTSMKTVGSKKKPVGETEAHDMGEGPPLVF